MALKEYHRPESVEAALTLLNRPQVRSMVIAGGTHLTPRAKQGLDDVVDLQAVGLANIQHTPTTMTLGAMVRLQTIVDDEEAPVLVRQAALREGPSTMRNQATIGGTLVNTEPTSELVAALLVLQAEVTVVAISGERKCSLADLLSDVTRALDGGLVTAISLVKTGDTASARVARTPQDRPIVAALGCHNNGELRLALCGVARTPALVNPQELDALQPPTDFCGSAGYRKEMARVLVNRVIQEIG